MSILTNRLNTTIVSTTESEKEVSNGTSPAYPFIGIRAGGALLINDTTLNISTLKGTDNQKVHAGIGASTGKAVIENCTLDIDAATNGILASNEPLLLKSCNLEITGGHTAGIVNQFSSIDLVDCVGSIDCTGSESGSSVGITAQRTNGKISLTNCELSLEADLYGIMSLANDVHIASSQIDFPSALSYGIYAVNALDITNNSTINGENCTFACRIPAAKGCNVDNTSTVNGLQIYNGTSTVMALGNVYRNATYAESLGKNLAGRTFIVAPDAKFTIEEDATFDTTTASSVEIQGEITNYGTLKLNGTLVQNTGVLTNWNTIDETEGTALKNNGEVYTVCTSLFEVEGNDIILMHNEQPAVFENVVPATCTEDGSQEAVVYCNRCNTEISRETQVLQKTNHSWNEPVWKWSADGKSCVATFVCENDSSHLQAPQVTITSEVAVPPTSTEAGTTTYTATIEFEGKVYTSTKDVMDIPATGQEKPESSSDNNHQDDTAATDNTALADTGDRALLYVWVASLVAASATLAGIVIHNLAHKRIKQ